MKFKNIIIIEKTGNVPINEQHLFCGPMKMGDIELFEDFLIKRNQSYILAQVDTRVSEIYKGNRILKKVNGYCLFIKNYNMEKYEIT